jgi:hypothetical protein
MQFKGRIRKLTTSTPHTLLSPLCSATKLTAHITTSWSATVNIAHNTLLFTNKAETNCVALATARSKTTLVAALELWLLLSAASLLPMLRGHFPVFFFFCLAWYCLGFGEC